tara:strand:+ start:396 stop:830 length:435 start_codon:yes stop_codon:yes gene_type:complete
MVQLNPFKWGNKKKKEALTIKKLDRVASSRRTQGGAGIRRNQARQKLKEMGVESTAEKEAKAKKAAWEKKKTEHSAKSRYERKHGRPRPTATTNKSSTSSKSKGKGSKVLINGKRPTMTQRQLLAGGWSVKELEAKINARKKKK